MKSKRSGVLAALLSFIVLLDSASVGAFPIFFEKEPEESRVPIIMYHLITKNGRYQGKFGISPEEMEADLKYLSENGYETVVVSDLIRFVDRKDELPEKPVMLTFDDGCSSDYYYLLPLLEKYDMKAVSSIIGKVTDDYSKDNGKSKKPHLDWEQVKEMHRSKRVEIQNHSYNLHGGGGSGRKRGESAEAYKERFCTDLTKAQERIEENTKKRPTAFAYPLGIIGKGSEDALKEMGYEASFSSTEGMNIIKQDEPDCLFGLKRNVRRSGSPISEVLRRAEERSKK